MNKIYKFTLGDVYDGVLREIQMPQGTRILAVQVHKSLGGILGYLETECPFLWALVNTDEGRMVRRMFRIYGTGTAIEEDPADLDYIGTFQTGPYVWHIFERKSE